MILWRMVIATNRPKSQLIATNRPEFVTTFRQAKGGVWNGGGWIRQITGPEFWNFRA